MNVTSRSEKHGAYRHLFQRVGNATTVQPILHRVCPSSYMEPTLRSDCDRVQASPPSAAS